MKSNYWLSILLSLRITYASWIIHAPPFGRTAVYIALRRAAPDGRTRERESKKGRQVSKRRSMVLMHKTCIFTKPVFTDVNTRYARRYTGGEQGGCSGEGESPRGGPHRAKQRYLFILPRRIENSFAGRGCTRAVYILNGGAYVRCGKPRILLAVYWTASNTAAG